MCGQGRLTRPSLPSRRVRCRPAAFWRRIGRAGTSWRRHTRCRPPRACAGCDSPRYSCGRHTAPSTTAAYRWAATDTEQRHHSRHRATSPQQTQSNVATTDTEQRHHNRRRATSPQQTQSNVTTIDTEERNHNRHGATSPQQTQSNVTTTDTEQRHHNRHRATSPQQTQSNVTTTDTDQRHTTDT